MKENIPKPRALVVLAAVLVSLIAITAMVMAAPAQVIDGSDDVAEQEAEVSHRLIVQLESPSLSELGTAPKLADGSIDLAASDAQDYISQLRAEQADFVSAMNQVLPEATVSTYINESGQEIQATYQLLFNGVAVDPGSEATADAKRKLQALPGVKAVFNDYSYTPDLYASLEIINAPAAWADLGGRENAGDGVRVASMDGGVHHDAPMFDGDGYTMPPGYPLGDTENTNGKIIVSRAYFRTWDPPAPGDENTWPGENGTPHGVHTASTAAGNVVTDAVYAGTSLPTLSGVAPNAYVMSYRMFYNSVSNDGSFYTVEGIAALEDIVADGAQVLNNSWGGGPGSVGGEFDPLDAALINAVNAGVFVSMSAGNAGPGLGTGDHPSPDYINVAATSTDGTYATGSLSVSGPSPVPTDLVDIPFALSTFGGTFPFGQVFTFTFTAAANVDPANFEGCDPFPAGTFDGQAAVISRGACEFGTKVLNAENAGADFVIVHNTAAEGDTLISMAPGEDGGAVTIPSVFIGYTAGSAMVDWHDTHGDDAELELSTIAEQVGNEPDVVANFSSRGPNPGNVLKPDIAAPGVNIMAQGYTPGATGEDRHLGYGQASGTSMAAPHVAGAAALVLQEHPGWTPGQIKSALMSTSQYMDIYNADGSPAQPLDIGAGRLDLTNAFDPGVILDPPSLSFGQMVTGTSDTIAVQVTSVATETETYDLSTLYTGDSFTQTTSLPGFTINTGSIELDPGETETISVTFDSTTGMGIGDNQGYIILEGDNGHHAHMPAWARVTPPDTGDVLLIDNDFSFLLGLPDYRDYYTAALDELGISYDVWHADANFGNPTTLPHAAVLSSYDAVILFTGDNFYPDGSFTVPTPLTQEDMDRLNEYAIGGGVLIVMGQDATAVMDESFLVESTLGAVQLQDSVTNFQLPERLVLPLNEAPEAFDDVALDLSGPDNMVGQLPMPDPPPNLGNSYYLPLIQSSGDAPDVAERPTGSASIVYDLDSMRLDYSVTISVTDPVTLTAAHIHEGSYGVHGPVLYPLFDGSQYITDTYTFDGSVIIDAADEPALLDGGLYINAHTTDHPFSAVRTQIWLVAGNDGANNQFFMDELEPFPGLAPEPVPGTYYPYQPFLYYPGPYNIDEGVVGMLHRDNPTLDYPGVSFPGRAAFTSFGLEGVNTTPDTTSRAELLQLLLDWGNDEPTVTIEDRTDEYENTSLVTFLEANVDSNIDGIEGATYRWDFGDGSDYAGPYESNLAGHEYDTCDTYTVRVEATDTFGNSVIGEQEITVENCPTPPTATDGN
ncbi:MAG: S8 family serine peptidase [Chloroflexota bacterium]